MTERHRFSSKFKAQVVLEVLTGAKTTAEACREYRLGSQVLGRWRMQFLEESAAIFEKAAGHTEEEQRIAELERVVGRLTIELEAVRRASSSLTPVLSRNGR